MEAATEVMRRFGTGPGRSRFLCGNLTMHEALESFGTRRYKTFRLLEKET